jgi:hypothetical protein
MAVVDESVGPSEDQWYAFVESEDGFRTPIKRTADGEWWNDILRRRAILELLPPTRIVWMSCIRANYFDALPWLDEDCDVGNEGQSSRRRTRLLSISSSELLVLPLLLCASESENTLMAEITAYDWHRIQLGPKNLYPVWTASDFDLGFNGTPTQLDYLGACSEGEMMALRSVFNLDFLEDEDFGGEQERGPLPPVGNPGPTDSRGRRFVKERRVVQLPSSDEELHYQ